jgi:hypothetical protein
MNRAEKRLPPPAKFYSVDYSYRATGSDGLRYSSETSAEFLEILDARQVSDIEMRYSDSSNHARIDISFSQELSRYGSTISNNIQVVGTDSMWVRAVTDEMEEAVAHFQKQDQWLSKYADWLGILASLIFGGLIYRVGQFVFTHIVHITLRFSIFEIAPGYGWFWWVLRLLGCGILGFPLAYLLMSNLFDLWPNVEMRMGYDWNQILPKRKRRLFWFFTALILPLLLSAVYDLLKHFAVL